MKFLLATAVLLSVVSAPPVEVEAQEMTAKEIYKSCRSQGVSDFEVCISNAVRKDQGSLRRDFVIQWESLQKYLRDLRPSHVSPSCRAHYIQFTKVNKNAVRLEVCKSDRECRTLEREVSLVLTEKQRGELMKESGGEIDCRNPKGLCARTYNKLLGFPVVDNPEYGRKGISITRVEPKPNDMILGKQAYYVLTRKVQFILPPKELVERMPRLFSNRGRSVVADLVDNWTREAKIRNVVFNIHLAQTLAHRLKGFQTSKTRSLRFSFFDQGAVCADEIYQGNRVRRGMNLDEVIILGKKDESGDLAHTVGSALKGFGNGFSFLITGFVKEQVLDEGHEIPKDL